MFVAISELTGPSAPSIGREVSPELDLVVVHVSWRCRNAAQTELEAGMNLKNGHTCRCLRSMKRQTCRSGLTPTAELTGRRDA